MDEQEAIATILVNQKFMRNGSPPIVNVLDILPAKLRAEVMDDAQAVIDGLKASRVEAPVVKPSEALFGFMGWLTSREEVSGPFSSRHEAGQAVTLISAFMESQGFEDPDDRYTDKLKDYPKGAPAPDTSHIEAVPVKSDPLGGDGMEWMNGKRGACEYCKVEDSVFWNQFNGVVQCHACGTNVPAESAAVTRYLLALLGTYTVGVPA